MPRAVTRIEIDGETHLAIEDRVGLLSLVQIGVLEIHPWGSTIDKLEQPDRVTFDLDPDQGLAWSRVTEAALEIRDVLTGLGLQSFVKTTGGKGLHVVMPLTPRLGWEEVKNFTRAVAEDLAARHPQRYTANQSKRARTGRSTSTICATHGVRRRSAPTRPVRGQGPRSRRRCRGVKSKRTPNPDTSPSPPSQPGSPP